LQKNKNVAKNKKKILAYDEGTLPYYNLEKKNKKIKDTKCYGPYCMYRKLQLVITLYHMVQPGAGRWRC